MSAKIILNKAVEGLGEKHDIVSVKDGYARNYLFPKKLAVKWTKKAEDSVNAIIASAKTRATNILEKAQNNADLLSTVTIEIGKKTTPTDTLYGGLTEKDVVVAVKKHYNIDIPVSSVHFNEPIKALGPVLVPIKLAENISTNLKVNVIKEK